MDTVSAEELESRAASGDVQAQLDLALRLDADGDANRAREWMRRAAVAGDTRAKAALALRLVSYPPLDVVEGARLAREAAADQSPEAMHVLSLLSTEGLGVPQSWDVALDYLARAAEFGHRTACIELAVLSGDWRLAREIAQGLTLAQHQCRRLRSTINLSALLQVPQPYVVSMAPRIAVVEKFLSPEVCDWLINVSRPMLQRARVIDYQTGAVRDDPVRDNSAMAMTVGGSDLVFATVRARIAALTGLPVSGLEVTAILRYEVGQKYLAHYDYFDKNSPGQTEDFSGEGQRVVTFLVYLNDDYVGGETAFPVVKARYKGRKGDALFFWNVAPDGAPDGRTLHAGLPPTRGEKWLLSQWIRYRLA